MARAKRTSRAEARRRYRAQVAEQATAVDDAETATDGTAPRAAAPARSGRIAASPAARDEPPRVGMRYAFRAAFHPVNLRDDLAHLREIVLSRAVLIPSAISIATAIGIGATAGNELFSRLLAQYFLVPPPIGSIFIAGFFAKRASYLAGLIVGLVAALALTGLITLLPAMGGSPGLTTTPTPTPIASGSPAGSVAASASSAASASASASAAPSASASAAASGTPIGPVPAPVVNTTEVATYALVTSPLAGIAFASAAAWYRRFLQLSNPNRAARPNRNTKGRPNTRRR